MAARILVVDDEKNIVKGIMVSLAQDGYETDAAYDGNEALEKIRNGNYDLVILDLMLPGQSGTQVCCSVREFSNVPILMLTAKSEDMDKILGLEYGADDYMTKPFNILELKARVRAILRRTRDSAAAQSKRIIENGDIRMDKDNRRVEIAGREISLTGKEFELLELLASHPGKVYSRSNLLQLVWGRDYPGDERTVDVHIRRLREKIEQTPSEPAYVQTKWGVGYYCQGKKSE